MIVPSKIERTVQISARWLMVPEWPPPPAPNAGQAVNTSRDRLFSETDAGDVMEHLQPPTMGPAGQFGRITADRDDDLDAVAPAEIEMGRQFLCGHPRRQIDRDRADAEARLSGMRIEVTADVAEPRLEFFEIPSIRAWQPTN